MRKFGALCTHRFYNFRRLKNVAFFAVAWVSFLKKCNIRRFIFIQHIRSLYCAVCTKTLFPYTVVAPEIWVLSLQDMININKTIVYFGEITTH